MLGLLSLNGFKMPKNGVLIGFDDQSDLDDVVHIAQTLKGLGFSIHTSKDCQAFVSLLAICFFYPKTSKRTQLNVLLIFSCRPRD